MNARAHWKLNLVEHASESKMQHVSITKNIGELIGCSSDYILGYDIGPAIEGNMLAIDCNISADVIRGIRAAARDIKIIAVPDYTDYPKGIDDRNFKLAMIQLTAGFDAVVIGDQNKDYMCKKRLFVIDCEETKELPVLDNASLSHIISGTTILTGEQSTDKFYYHYDLQEQLHLIEQRQAFMTTNTDECCRLWFEAFMPEV